MSLQVIAKILQALSLVECSNELLLVGSHQVNKIIDVGKLILMNLDWFRLLSLVLHPAVSAEPLANMLGGLSAVLFSVICNFTLETLVLGTCIIDWHGFALTSEGGAKTIMVINQGVGRRYITWFVPGFPPSALVWGFRIWVSGVGGLWGARVIATLFKVFEASPQTIHLD